MICALGVWLKLLSDLMVGSRDTAQNQKGKRRSKMVDMKTSIKPLIFGFLTGIALVFVSVLGLVVAFIEFLQPVLTPGTEFLRALPEGFLQSFLISLLIAGILLNGIIYAVLFFVISLAQRNTHNKGIKVAAIALVILIFLTVSGMVADFLAFLASPDKSWIFEVGAQQIDGNAKRDKLSGWTGEPCPGLDNCSVNPSGKRYRYFRRATAVCPGNRGYRTDVGRSLCTQVV